MPIQHVGFSRIVTKSEEARIKYREREREIREQSVGGWPRRQAWLASAADAEGLRRMPKGTFEEGPNAGGGTQGPDVRQGARTGIDRGS